MSYFIKSKFYVKLIVKNLIFSMIFYQNGNMYKCLCIFYTRFYIKTH